MTARKRPPEDPRGLPPALPRGEAFTIELDGQPVRAFTGETVAAALWADGIRVLSRSPKYHRPRGPFCLAGHCASCYVRVAGRPNVRACMTPTMPGLACERQNAFPDAEIDFLRAADWLFPEGMDHHHLMTGTKVGNALFRKVVRQMGGSGTLPDAPAPPAEAPLERVIDVCVVGAGPAGLAAATAVCRAGPGLRVLVVDEGAAPGGSLLAYPGGLARGDALARDAAAAGAELASETTVVAHYPEDALPGEPPGLLAAVHRDRLWLLRARTTIYATGSYDQNLAFEDNDRPEVLAARACGRLAFHFGIMPARRVVVLEDPALPFAYADTLASGLEALGIRVARAALEGPRPPRARGAVVAAAALPAPASELPRQHGVSVRFDVTGGGYAAIADEHGATAVAGVYAAGDVTGFRGPEEAVEAGARTGRAVAAALT